MYHSRKAIGSAIYQNSDDEYEIWVERLQKCIVADSVYFEDDKLN
jgi:hypothetical protein